MMNQERVSSAVYGLFYEVDYEGQSLLGLYNLEGEAEAARAHYIAIELEDFDFSAEEKEAERVHLERQVVVRRLAMGQVPSLRFAA
jgi:hypothetical protein